MYPPELQLNKANTSDIEAPFLYSHLFIYNGFVSSKINGKTQWLHQGLLELQLMVTK